MWLCGPAKVAAISARPAHAGTVGLASGESAREAASQLRRDFWPTLALEWATQLVESSSQSHLGRAAVKC